MSTRLTICPDCHELDTACVCSPVDHTRELPVFEKIPHIPRLNRSLDPKRSATERRVSRRRKELKKLRHAI